MEVLMVLLLLEEFSEGVALFVARRWLSLRISTSPIMCFGSLDWYKVGETACPTEEMDVMYYMRCRSCCFGNLHIHRDRAAA